MKGSSIIAVGLLGLAGCELLSRPALTLQESEVAAAKADVKAELETQFAAMVHAALAQVSASANVGDVEADVQTGAGAKSKLRDDNSVNVHTGLDWKWGLAALGLFYPGLFDPVRSKYKQRAEEAARELELHLRAKGRG